MKRIHHLKCLAQYFEVLDSGEKTFEIRRDDRGFQRGDYLEIRCTNEAGANFTAVPPLRFEITWILTGGQFGIEPGYVALALKRHEGDFHANA